jgi:hypothetical protein
MRAVQFPSRHVGVGTAVFRQAQKSVSSGCLLQYRRAARSHHTGFPAFVQNWAQKGSVDMFVPALQYVCAASLAHGCVALRSPIARHIGSVTIFAVATVTGAGRTSGFG